MNLKHKEQRLLAMLQNMQKPAVAFSGGVDSSLLLAACVRAGVEVLPVFAATPLVPEFEKRDAAEVAASLKLQLHILSLSPLEDKAFSENTADRCYICKKMLFGAVQKYGFEQGCDVLLDGANADDAGDYRPGMQAARELGTVSPLLDCGFTKSDVRALAAAYNLKVADKPAYACLASRIAYGEPVTDAKLRKVEAAEAALRKMGFTDVRVRCHGSLARIEVNSEQIARAAGAARAEITAALQQAGFKYVTLDLQGFVSGSMNRIITGK